MSKINDKRLTVFFNSTDLSESCVRMGEDEAVITVANFESDALFLGYKKPVKNIFFEVSQALNSGLTKTVQIWNGTDWVNISAVDDTKHFNKSNFLYIDGDQIKNSVSKEVNGQTLFWLKVIFSGNGSVKFKGINSLFCSESDLKNEEPAIAKFYPRDLSSHIFSLVAAREFILRKINNSDGWYKYEGGLLSVNDFNQFDVFNIDELRDAAVFYTLYKIFFNRSDEADDFYYQKSQEYLNRFNECFKLWQGRKITLDRDGDGVVSESEKYQSVQKGSFYR